MMKTLVRSVAVTLVVAYLSDSDIRAREVQDWDYDHLVACADLVVIATVVSSKPVRFDFEGVEPWASWLRTPEGPKLRDILAAEVTTFRVKAWLKGEAEGQTVDVFHFSYTGPVPESLVGAPRLLREGLGEETTRGDIRSIDGRRTGNYLLFLKRGIDRSFEPVTGQVDSGYSVKQIRSLVPP
jgi:hypothetical protein